MMIKSIEEFKIKYFPKTYKKELESKMTPGELGRKWASELMDKMKKRCK